MELKATILIFFRVQRILAFIRMNLPKLTKKWFRKNHPKMKNPTAAQMIQVATPAMNTAAALVLFQIKILI